MELMQTWFQQSDVFIYIYIYIFWHSLCTPGYNSVTEELIYGVP